MIRVALSYSFEEAQYLFLSAGLTVEHKEVEIDFDNASNELAYPEWVVINPYTQTAELLETAFRRYMESRKDLFSEGSRMDVYKSFNR